MKSRLTSLWLVLAVLLVIGLLTGCAQPTPQVKVVKETVPVPVTKVVEKKVEVTKVVEKKVLVTPTPPPPPPTEITMFDTNSGANFQWYWQNVVIPDIQADLGIKVNYVVGKSSEVIQRMKAWKPGQGDIHLLFVKPGHIADMVLEGIPLEVLWPDKKDVIPNLAKCPEDYLKIAQGVDIGGKGALYWRSQYALIYNTEYIKDPPTSWKEFYERRAEWKGHIGLVRPDSKSGSGRRQPYTFLYAFLDDKIEMPLDELMKTPEWKDAWAKLKDFYTYAKLPLAAEPTNMFEDFNAGDTWITVYAMDFSLWSARQGTMPPTIKATFLKEGIPAGSDGYLAVPANIPEEYKPVVYKVINYLLSDYQQIKLVTTMWQYPGTDIWDKIPAIVWENIPRWEDVEKARVLIKNKELADFIKEKGPELLVPKG